MIRFLERLEREIDVDLPKFFDTNGISYQLDEIIRNPSGGRLLLISPFLKFSPRIRDELKRQDDMKRDIRVVYGKRELHPEEAEWLARTKIRSSYLEHLHAKCYMNETHALITSMNLYEYSQQNNYEMGILVSKENDSELYRSIKEGADRILDSSKEEEFKFRVTRVDGGDLSREQSDNPARSESKRESATAQRQTLLPETGFCLRCGTEIPCVLKRPYCDTHYRSWARYKNEDYEEKRCHTCGAEHSSSMAKPVCLACYRKYRGAFRAAS